MGFFLLGMIEGFEFSFDEESYCFFVRHYILAKCCKRLTGSWFLCFGDPTTAFRSLLPFLENEAFLPELPERPRIYGEAPPRLEDYLKELRVLLCFEMLGGGSLFWRTTASRLLIRSNSLFSLSLASTSTTCFGSF